MKKLLLDFFSFLKHPSDQKYIKQGIGFKIGVLFFFALLCLLLDILGLIVKSYVSDIGSIDPLMRTNPFEHSILLTFLFGVVIAALSEETAFRLLLRFKPLNLWISFIVLFAMLLRMSYKVSFVFFISFAVVVLLLILYFIIDQKRVHEKLQHFWSKKFWVVFYFSALLFGCIHFTNYHFELKNLPFIFFITLPQIFAGIILGYVRIKFGFHWGIYLHALSNFILMSPMLLVFFITGNKDTNDKSHNEVKEYFQLSPLRIYLNSKITEVKSKNNIKTYYPFKNDRLDVYCNQENELIISKNMLDSIKTKSSKKQLGDELKIDSVEIIHIATDTSFTMYYKLMLKHLFYHDKFKWGMAINDDQRGGNHTYSWVDKEYEKYNFIEIILQDGSKCILFAKELGLEKENFKGLVIEEL